MFGENVSSYNVKTKTVTIEADPESGLSVGDSLFSVRILLSDSMEEGEYTVELTDITLTDLQGSTYRGVEAKKGTVTVHAQIVNHPMGGETSNGDVPSVEDGTVGVITDDSVSTDRQKKGCFGVIETNLLCVAVLVAGACLMKKRKEKSEL